MDDLTSQEAYLYDYRMNITSLVDQGDSEVANRTKILDDLEERIVTITDNFASSVDYFIGLNIFLFLDLNFLSESFQQEFQKDKMKTDLANDVNMQTYNAYLGIVVEKSNQFQVMKNFKMLNPIGESDQLDFNFNYQKMAERSEA